MSSTCFARVLWCIHLYLPFHYYGLYVLRFILTDHSTEVDNDKTKNICSIFFRVMVQTKAFKEQEQRGKVKKKYDQRSSRGADGCFVHCDKANVFSCVKPNRTDHILRWRWEIGTRQRVICDTARVCEICDTIKTTDYHGVKVRVSWDEHTRVRHRRFSRN